MGNRVEISVIVPVYNAVNCIDRCIASLVAQQTVWEYELLFVDDGSSDESLAVLREWERRDRRIRVLTQQNQGPSAARNYGLREARGSYIIFADSDDWVDSCYIDSLRNGVDADKPGLVIGGFYREKLSGGIEYTEPTQIYDQSEFHKILNSRELYRKGFPFGKVFETATIRKYGLIFNEGIHYGEDLIFLFSYLIHVEYVRFIDCCGYHYDQTNQGDSLGLRYHSYESELAGYRLLKDAVDKLTAAYHISEEELRQTTGRLVYFLLRAIKVMYRPGDHHLKYETRQQHLKEDLLQDDVCLLESYSSQCRGINKVICICLKDGRTAFLDVILSLFFFCRYSWLGKRFVKCILK